MKFGNNSLQNWRACREIIQLVASSRITGKEGLAELKMANNELIINGIYYKVAQINGQKIAEPAQYNGPEPPENAEVRIPHFIAYFERN